MKNQEKNIALIDEIDFFSTLSEEERRAVLDCASFEIHPSKEVIVRKGEFSVDYYLVLEGSVEGIFIQQGKIQATSKVGKGEGFGETALLGKKHRETTYQSLCPTTVLRIDIPSLRSKKGSAVTKFIKRRALQQHEIIKTLKTDFSKFLSESGKAKSYYPSTHSFYNESNTLSLEDLNRFVQGKKMSLPKDITSPLSGMSVRAGVVSGEKAGSIKEAIEKGSSVIEKSQKEAIKREEEEKKKQQDISLENYDNIIRKLYLTLNQLQSTLPSLIQNTLLKNFSNYLQQDSKWSSHAFVQGTHQLKNPLHIVCLCPFGELAYRTVFPYLPFSHRVIGLSNRSVVGTFLGSNQQIEAYFNDSTPELALRLDRLMPLEKPKTAVEKSQEIGKLKDGQEIWEDLHTLSHTGKDVNPHTLFVVFDSEMGTYTQFVKKRFPSQACVTVIKGFEYDLSDMDSLFSLTERKLEVRGLLYDATAPLQKGFVKGSTYFLSDLSSFYQKHPQFNNYAFVFSTLSLLSQLAPETTEVAWGSSGGSSGVLKAVRILYGNKGPKDMKDIEAAVRWADRLKSKS